MKCFFKVSTNSYDKYKFLFINYLEIRYGRTLIVKVLGVPVFVINRKGWFWRKIDDIVHLANDNPNKTECNLFFFRHNIGENVAYLMAIEGLVKYKKIDNVVLVAINDAQESLLELFYKSKYKIIKYKLRIEDLRRFVKDDTVKYKNNINIYAPGVDLSERLIRKFYEKPKYTIFDFVCETLKVDSDKMKFVHPVGNADISNYLLEKNLQCDFIMIFPDAQSMIMLSDVFWGKLINCLLGKGYKVFINGKKNKYCGTITDFLDFEQTFALAKKAKGIIGMGSGIAMMLSQTGTPGDYIYTEFYDGWFGYTAGVVRKIYSLKDNAIGNDGIREYVLTKELDENIIIDKILSEY